MAYAQSVKQPVIARLVTVGTVQAMGCFDTVHFGSRCCQIKALGKGLRDYRRGDRVALVEVDAFPGGEDFPRFDVSAFQVEMGSGGFLQVRDSTIVDWTTDPDPVVPLFDNGGHQLEVPNGPRWDDEAGDCEVCAAIRGDQP